MSPIHTTDGWSCLATCKEKAEPQAGNAAPSGVRTPPRPQGSPSRLSGAGSPGAPVRGCTPPSLQDGAPGPHPARGLHVLLRDSEHLLNSVWLEMSNGFMLQTNRGGGGSEPRVLMPAHPPLPGVGRFAHREKSCFSTRAPGMPCLPLRVALPLWPRRHLDGDSGAPPGRAGLCDRAGPYRGPTNNCHTPNNPFEAPR